MRELHYILRRRSLDYLRVSEDALSRGLYDVGGVLAQISAELAVKATISFLGYSFPETHEIRRLLGVLSSITLKDEIQNFINAWFKRLGLMRRKREKKKVIFILSCALISGLPTYALPNKLRLALVLRLLEAIPPQVVEYILRVLASYLLNALG